MILHCTFEELSALTAGGERIVAAAGAEGGVAAPPEMIAELEAFLPRLTGDLSIATLADVQRVERVVDLILAHHRHRMDAFILEQYVGADDAVNAYFDYAYVLTFRRRLREMAEEMRALAAVLCDGPITPDVARKLTFPD